jgi:hypothetical protein
VDFPKALPRLGFSNHYSLRPAREHQSRPREIIRLRPRSIMRQRSCPVDCIVPWLPTTIATITNLGLEHTAGPSH